MNQTTDDQGIAAAVRRRLLQRCVLFDSFLVFVQAHLGAMNPANQWMVIHDKSPMEAQVSFIPSFEAKYAQYDNRTMKPFLLNLIQTRSMPRYISCSDTENI